MKILILLLLLFCIVPTYALEYKFVKKVDVGRLQAELKTAGFNVTYIAGDGVNNTLVMAESEVKNPQAIIDAHVYIDFKARLEANKIRMIVLAKKWMARTITTAEKDELIKRFIISSILLEELE